MAKIIFHKNFTDGMSAESVETYKVQKVNSKYDQIIIIFCECSNKFDQIIQPLNITKYVFLICMPKA